MVLGRVLMTVRRRVSDRVEWLVERDGERILRVDVGAERVVAAAEVLHEGVAGGDDPKATCRDHDVEDLAGLVDGPVDVAPAAGDSDVGLVDEPAGTSGVASRAGGLDELLRGEPLYPPVQRDVVDLDAALGEQLFEIPVGQAEAQVSAHRQEDHLRWELDPSEGRPVDLEAGTGPAAVHRTSLADHAPHRCKRALAGGHGKSPPLTQRISAHWRPVPRHDWWISPSSAKSCSRRRTRP